MVDQIIQLLYSALFFITPLIMTKTTSELFEFNKMLFIYTSTVLIAFFWFLKMVINKKIILKKTPLDIPILIFFLSQLISTIISIDRHTSIFGYYGRFNGGLISIICYIVLYYGLVSNITNIEKLLKSIIASSLLVILWAIPGHFGRDLTCLLFTGEFNNSCWDNTTLAFRPELRAFSTLGQPNWLGAYLAVAFFIGIYFLIKNIKNVQTPYRASLRKQILPSIYLFLNFSMILMSRSRSAIGAVIVGLILFVGYYFFFIKSNFTKILVILLIITIVPILLFKTGEDKIDKYLSISNIKNQISKIQIKNQKVNGVKINQGSNIEDPTSTNVTESFDIRKIVWEGAWKLAMRYPLFGTGVETFAYSYNFVRPVTHNLTSEWDYVYNKAHNEYFNYLATTGFVGLGSYLLLICSFILISVIPLKKGIQSVWIPASAGMTKSKKQNNIAIEQSNNETMLTVCLLIAYITILITNFFGFSTTTIQLFFYLIPAIIILGNNQQTETKKFEKVVFHQWLVIFILAISTIYFLFSIIIYYLADVNYSYGLKYSKINDQQKAAGYFERALKLRAEPVYMDKFSSSLAYLSAVANMQNQIELSKQIANLSDSYNKKTIQDYPKNIFYWKTRAKNMYYFFQMTGKEDELLHGVEALKKARELSPTDPKIPYSLALYYSIIYDTTKNNSKKKEWQKLSLQEIDKSIRLKSNYQEAYSLKSELLKKYLR
ncbi:MAG: O-antigen ligase family protein [Patescibacteria group bacterium]